MVDRAVAAQWMAKAEEDFQFASRSIGQSEDFLSPVCFHFQPADEKYLKTFIVARDLALRKVHDLDVLLAECRASDPTLHTISEDCSFLTDFYIETRYPVHWPGNITLAEARQARDAAGRIRDAIRQRLGFE